MIAIWFCFGCYFDCFLKFLVGCTFLCLKYSTVYSWLKQISFISIVKRTFNETCYYCLLLFFNIWFSTGYLSWLINFKLGFVLIIPFNRKFLDIFLFMMSIVCSLLSLSLSVSNFIFLKLFFLLSVVLFWICATRTHLYTFQMDNYPYNFYFFYKKEEKNRSMTTLFQIMNDAQRSILNESLL